jgi:PEP-CTERM motif
LSNSGTVSIGNTGLTTATTVTATGLSNTGTINLAGNITANSTGRATVTVNGQASNAGTVNIPTNTSVTVTGTGNAYTQTAGFTNLSGGTLAAPNVNITGGTLHGMGTVAGTTNISGSGTIQALNLANNSLAAVLTIDGNYFQSGGTFSELLHGTGDQLDKVAVTSGHTVNLTGGNLQLSGISFALGQEFDNIMKFQPGGLSGTFAMIQGGGNGRFVDIGNGLRLNVIYDNAGGDISIQVGPSQGSTPAIPQINNAPITFAARTGDTVGTQGVSITNAAAASASTEGLIGNATGTTGTGITASGGFGPPTANPELGGQQTNATFIQVGIDASTAGVKSGNAVIDFKSDGTPFGGTVTDLGNTNVAVSGKIYTPAVANVLTTSPIDFGIVHVGDPTQSKSVTVQNGASATALNDGLVGTITAGGAPFSGSGAIAAPGLAPQASSSALQVNLATGSAGIFTGTANPALASHDADLADLALSTSPLSLSAQVNRFAALSFLKQGGDGALSDSFVLDFGRVAQGSGTLEALLAMLNDNPLADQAFTDLLSSAGAVGSGSGFRFTGCSVTKLPVGLSLPGCDIFFDTSIAGDFTEVLKFDVESMNADFDGFRDPVFLTLEGSVGPVTAAPEPGTMTLLGSGLGVLFFVVLRRRRTG